MPGSILGAAVKRTEDPRFIRGEGSYIPNQQVEGALHMVAVRSQVAHGRLLAIDTSLAAGMPGVVGVFTAEDLEVHPGPAGGGAPQVFARPQIATGVVRFVGEIVAVVVAETERQGVDAAGFVFADIEPLPVVVDARTAATAGSPLLFPEAGTNVAVDSPGPPSDAVDTADMRIALSIVNQRVAAIPLETNSALAVPEGDGIHLQMGSQNIFAHRNAVSRAAGIDRDLIHASVPDMGGGFGAKFYTYPEQVLVARLAIDLGTPVRWHESRRDNLIGMTQGRAQHIEVEIGATADGCITALRFDITQDVGAYPTFGAQLPAWTRLMASGVYGIEDVSVRYRSVVTNTTPIHAYRGAGRPEATHALERTIDALAVELGLDPAEIRRRNYIRPDQFPYTTPTGAEYDSGAYAMTLDRALALTDIATVRHEQQRRREAGEEVHLGVGMATYVEVTAPEGPKEWSAVEVHDSGRATVRVGTSGHGQGHETAFAQIASNRLGIAIEDITVLQADTSVIARGAGTGGSRSLQLAGSAVMRAGDQVLAKAKRIVAAHVEAAIEDIVLDDSGILGVAGVPGIGMTWGDIATAAARGEGLDDDEERSLSADLVFDQGRATYPFGTHVSVVEVDTVTGAVRIVRHIAVDDCGTVLNPLLVAGQVHGGFAQGAGQALYEQVVYDDDGNPLSGNLMSYLIPTADTLPSVERESTETPTPHNPLGAKGIGEAATIGSTPAIHNAVIDAVAHLGVRHVDMPLTPSRVWTAVRDATARAGTT